MTHLRIENQNSNVEIVNVAIILKLYNLSTEIEENLEEGESLSDYVSLKGNLLSEHARLGAYDYLTGNLTGTSTKRFPLLDINVTGGMYLDFGDPSVENILKQNSIGDGIGITSTDLYNVNALSSSLFGGSNITSFNELLYFNTTIFNQVEQFKDCSQLTSIILPSGTTSLHHGTFLGCISLTSVLNTLNLTSLANYTFKQCSFLSIDLLNITRIGDFTFQDCTNLQNIGTAAPNSVGNNAFNGCTALNSINLSHATSIGALAFLNCRALTSLDLSSCTFIENLTFYACTSLASITMPPVAYTIGNNSFESCTALTSIDLSNATSVGNGAFRGCTSLTSIDLSNVTTIGNTAFKGCTSLTSIDLSNVTSIGDSAFKGCTSLTSVNISGITTINNGTFMNCTSLTTIDLSGITTIKGAYNNGAFLECTSLTTVIGISDPRYIYDHAFRGCTSLGMNQDLVLNALNPNLSSTTVPLSYCFTSTKYKSAEIHCQYIVNCGSMFANCPNIKKIDFSDTNGVRAVDFHYYSSVETIILPENNPPMFDWRLTEDSSSLTKVVILSQTPPALEASNDPGRWHSRCHFYVPDAAVATYQSATGWSLIASRIHGLSSSDLNDITWYTKEHSAI